jgi:hypothetical protein
MTRLSCARCGQRYYGPPSPGLTCDLCHAPLEEHGWSPHGRRAEMVPLPVIQAPLAPGDPGWEPDPASTYAAIRATVRADDRPLR